jgi:hypothetical protein
VHPFPGQNKTQAIPASYISLQKGLKEGLRQEGNKEKGEILTPQQYSSTTF